ncbi:hypothetical protein NDU88_007467 [Pleurodeles waltl]|uniref:Uncharacterized protein n=1 Tax=Pleurodeles waltl TaxID=8319 RepID=A0AAV7SSH3_PLEWA|nr:hypothetical protein NDU88_007467 [Pleurodeles waltl]
MAQRERTARSHLELRPLGGRRALRGISSAAVGSQDSTAGAGRVPLAPGLRELETGGNGSSGWPAIQLLVVVTLGTPLLGW